MASLPIELHTLGGLELRRSGDAAASFIPLQTKRLVLLAYLAASPTHGFRRRDTLLGLFWPELDQEHARGSLRQALHILRKTVGDGAILTRGESEIGLDAAALRSDAHALEAALDAGDAVGAFSLFRGDFLEGVFVADASPELEKWIAAERIRLRRLAAQAAWAASERPGGRGDAAQYVRQAVSLSGDDEAALRRGLGLLDRMGDRAGAVALYEEFADRVARELDIELSAETQAAIQGVRDQRGSGPVISRAPIASAFGPMAPAAATPSGARPRRKRFLAGGIGAALTLALLAVMGPVRSATTPPVTDMVGVVPFRVHASDSGMTWLREGMVELVTMRLMGSEALRVVEPGRVLAAWHSALPGGTLDASPERLRRVADQAGATRIVQGSVSGTPDRHVLAAWVIEMPGGRTETQASVEGPADSLPSLVDRLSAKLLGLTTGVEGHRLASLEGAPPAAIRAFLAGRSAFRRGRSDEAAAHFRAALTIDSTFALAALDLVRAAGWTRGGNNGVPGGRLARKYSSSLSPADRALLDAMQRQWTNAPGMFATWRGAVAAYPERPETWYGLGDAYFHWGLLAGIDEALGKADAAFRRGWALDSAANGDAALAGPLVAEPMIHLVDLAHLRGDTAEVLRLTALVLLADSSSDVAQAVRWHRAVVEGPTARRDFWKPSGDADQRAVGNIVHFITWTGLAAEDLSRAAAAHRAGLQAHDPGFAANELTAMALNSGRPGDVPRLRNYADYAPREDLRRRLKDWAFWGGDSSVAISAAGELSRVVDAPPLRGAGARLQFMDICAMGMWRVARGDAAAAGTAAERLRATRIPGLTGRDSVSFVQHREFCSALLEASRAVAQGRSDAGPQVAHADSLARTYILEVCCGEAVTDANLILAQLWERLGDRESALRALRRRAGGYFLESLYVSTFLREEGRLAALTGDTAGAMRAYRHYLALRPNPDQSVRPVVEEVRRELAALERR
jgi:serine/threonine-protein kinase